ncbi:hypothetical protein HIR68_03920 [Staphylococcus coagulans]|uniref:MepB family protein n=1 Tax=Staphylococcus coagulans TaxID=74706 RepID=A0ABU1F1I6_9STAP|nr:MepB family protein [Staphylococcus coagulans]MBT2831076.1 hypothetical protein [Staphylococcus coagulans]MBT2859528.1 hypothetical protein [Staphylococcus coagulans]MBU3873036.1 MepB family protein [Staphylococcus coagulans]MDR5604229.1 MepB family protein [Staphylococcus coagulans]UNB48630.1 MepB family protein [Staphylococcus coagulans]
MFKFSKQILIDKNILRYENSKGKMAMRVYPSWEEKLNPTASRERK